MKSLNKTIFSLVFFSSLGLAQTGDKNTLLQIAQGDKLVLKTDLFLPANTERIYFNLKIDSGYKNSGCALVLIPSQKSRKILQQNELVFSGANQQKQSKNEFGHTDYLYSAGIMNSEGVIAVECYGTTFQSNFQDLYVAGMKNELKEAFEFVATEPEIIH